MPLVVVVLFSGCIGMNLLCKNNNVEAFVFEIKNLDKKLDELKQHAIDKLQEIKTALHNYYDEGGLKDYYERIREFETKITNSETKEELEKIILEVETLLSKLEIQLALQEHRNSGEATPDHINAISYLNKELEKTSLVLSNIIHEKINHIVEFARKNIDNNERFTEIKNSAAAIISRLEGNVDILMEADNNASELEKLVNEIVAKQKTDKEVHIKEEKLLIMAEELDKKIKNSKNVCDTTITKFSNQLKRINNLLRCASPKNYELIDNLSYRLYDLDNIINRISECNQEIFNILANNIIRSSNLYKKIEKAVNTKKTWDILKDNLKNSSKLYETIKAKLKCMDIIIEDYLTSSEKHFTDMEYLLVSSEIHEGMAYRENTQVGIV